MGRRKLIQRMPAPTYTMRHFVTAEQLLDLTAKASLRHLIEIYRLGLVDADEAIEMGMSITRNYLRCLPPLPSEIEQVQVS